MSLFAHLFDYQTTNASNQPNFHFRRIRDTNQNLAQRKQEMMNEIVLVQQNITQGKCQYMIFSLRLQ